MRRLKKDEALMARFITLHFEGYSPEEIVAEMADHDIKLRRVRRYLRSVGIKPLKPFQRQVAYIAPIRVTRTLAHLARELGMSSDELSSAIIQREFEDGIEPARRRLSRFKRNG